MEKCPQCQNNLRIRSGQYGKFLGCVAYPDCRYTEKLPAVNNEAWIDASDVGQISFCPYAIFLRSQGKKSTAESEAIMAKGQVAHESITLKTRHPASVKACYLASYAFTPDHPIVNDLRAWRDSRLLTSIAGRLFVRCYYRISPAVITFFGHNRCFRYFAVRFVTWLHQRIKRGQK